MAHQVSLEGLGLLLFTSLGVQGTLARQQTPLQQLSVGLGPLGHLVVVVVVFLELQQEVELLPLVVGELELLAVVVALEPTPQLVMMEAWLGVLVVLEFLLGELAV